MKYLPKILVEGKSKLLGTAVDTSHKDMNKENIKNYLIVNFIIW